MVQRAPLAIPPEYALRPPSPGEPRPQELDPENAARAALTGGVRDPNASQGERLLVSKVSGGVLFDDGRGKDSETATINAAQGLKQIGYVKGTTIEGSGGTSK